MNKIVSVIILALLSGFLLVGCEGSRPRVAPVVDLSRSQYPSSTEFYRVGTGDTLYSVVWAFQLDDQDLIEWNHLTPPYELHFGQKLRIKAPRGQMPRHERIHPVEHTPEKAPISVVSLPFREERVHFSSHGKWHWPAEGRLTGGFSSQAFAEKGVSIAGRAAEPVVAALAGIVVYSGAQLAGYGNLILIKHDQDYISAYAFNQRNLVKDGDHVTAGQKIAEMGQDNSGRVRLYFEIRRHGKPVDPLPYLRG